jgi:CelD/BcsL family acetyltransferase involved in cellulose biosynthesis
VKEGFMSNLNIQIYQNEFPDALVQWCNNIAQVMCEPSFFCSGDWIASAMRFEQYVEIIVVSEGVTQDLVAVLPVGIKRNFLGGIDGRMLGVQFHPDPVGLVCKKERRTEAAAKIRHYFKAELNWDSLTIDWTTGAECEAWGAAGEKQAVAPYLQIDIGFAEVLARFRKKKRYNIKASVKQLMEVEGASFMECITQEEKQVCFQEFFRLHQMRAQERGIESSVTGSDFFEHHSTLLRESDYATIFKLEIDNQMLAVIYGFAFSNRFFYYQVAHNPEFGELSPGKVILYEAISHYSNLGYKEFNFLQGDEEYKGLWTNEKRQLFRLRLERRNLRTLTFRILGVMKSCLKRLRKRLRYGY